MISVGDAKTGKSCLIKRYCEGRFVPKYIPTVGVDYGVKPVKVRSVDLRVNLFDLSGDSDYLEIRNEFYRSVGGAMMVYDVTDRSTYDNLGGWIEEMRECGVADPSSVPTVLCANKSDRCPACPRRVTEAEGLAFAASHGMSYFETSAKTGESVQEALDGLCRDISSRPPISSPG